MERLMKQVSLVTSASLVFMAFFAIAISMPVSAETVFEIKSIVVSGEQDPIYLGNEGTIELTIIESFEEKIGNSAVPMTYQNATLISAFDDVGEDARASFILANPTESAIANAQAKTETNTQVLSVDTSELGVGEYTLEIGVSEDVSDTYTVVISREYEAIIIPEEIKLNKTTTSMKLKGGFKKNSPGAAVGIIYEWEFDQDIDDFYRAFELSSNRGEEIIISLSKDADKIFEEAQKQYYHIEKIEADLCLSVRADGISYKFATVSYTPIEEKKDDTSKAPAPAGTEIKGEQATYKVTGAGEAEYEAPKDATASTVVIPDEIKDANGNVYKVTTVAPNAFKKNKKVKTAKFGKYVTTIGAGAFDGASNLKNLELNGNVVKTIGKNAFRKTKKGLKVKIFAKNKKTAQKLFNKVVKKGKAKGAILKFKKRK